MQQAIPHVFQNIFFDGKGVGPLGSVGDAKFRSVMEKTELSSDKCFLDIFRQSARPQMLASLSSPLADAVDLQ